ncbi:MAG: hypothetical protein AVDCRST_MAG08-1689 [uncultured Acetobacteraceae bacterium]|uniref:Uncharacterized protein n=1 Tax=uncultured Acetobacteraceae bacterium TaxID=169975 RepID=A0A6J4I4M5_9PROT|nr:MAG: hypothetical protein AVDCRST_MAG08-1689 [uncultured Acetobacteraceae bacterium]
MAPGFSRRERDGCAARRPTRRVRRSRSRNPSPITAPCWNYGRWLEGEVAASGWTVSENRCRAYPVWGRHRPHSRPAVTKC